MSVADVLDAALYDFRTIRMHTKDRGIIVGRPSACDDFDFDPRRLGYYVSISDSEESNVFLDEITRVTDDETGEVLYSEVAAVEELTPA